MNHVPPINESLQTHLNESRHTHQGVTSPIPMSYCAHISLNSISFNLISGKIVPKKTDCWFRLPIHFEFRHQNSDQWVNINAFMCMNICIYIYIYPNLNVFVYMNITRYGWDGGPCCIWASASKIYTCIWVSSCGEWPSIVVQNLQVSCYFLDHIQMYAHFVKCCVTFLHSNVVLQ